MRLLLCALLAAGARAANVAGPVRTAAHPLAGGAAAVISSRGGGRALSPSGADALARALAARGWTAEKLAAAAPDAPELAAAAAEAAKELAASGTDAVSDLEALDAAAPSRAARAVFDAALMSKARAAAEFLSSEPGAAPVPAQPLPARTKALLAAISDPRKLDAEKAEAVRRFFDGLDAAGLEKAVAGQPLLGDAWKKLKSSGKLSPRQLDLLVELFRELVEIEQKKIFALATPAEGLSPRIEAGAALAKDGSYVANQASAMIGLLSSTRDIAKSLESSVSRGGRLRESDALERRFFDEYVPQVLRSVDKLGPFYTKLMQTIGTFVSMFSEKTSEAFKRLNDQLDRHMSIQQVHDSIERDLGGPASDFFTYIEPEPLASASIAQVHRARIKTAFGGERRVVIKVLKRSVVEELVWNLRVNQAVLRYFKTLTGDAFWLDLLAGQLDEFGKTFQAETDFRAEADRLIRWRALFRFDKGISTPKVYRRLSGPSIITMDEIVDAEKSDFSVQLSRLVPEGDKEETEKRPKDEQKTVEAAQPERDSREAAELKSFGPEAVTVKSEVPSQSVVESVPDGAEKPQASATSNTSRAKPDGERMLEASKDILVALMRAHKYRFGPQYFQVIRSFLPYLAVTLNANHQLELLESADLDPAGRAAVDTIKTNLAAYNRAYWRQVLYFGEVHADMHPANVLHTPGTLHVIDLGNTVVTRGLIWRPLKLALALARGDARALRVALERMGKLPADSDPAAVEAAIQGVLDKHGIVKRSTLGLIRSALAARKAAKAERAALEERLERRSEEVVLRSKRSPEARARIRKEIDVSAARPEGSASKAAEASPREPEPASVSVPTEAASVSEEAPSQPSKPGMTGRVVASIAKEVVLFPVRWLKYKTLGAFDRAYRLLPRRLS